MTDQSQIHTRIFFRSFITMLLTDAALAAACYYSAYLIRFEFSIPDVFIRSFLVSLPIVLVIKTGTFLFFRLYRGMWRYTSIPELIAIIEAVCLSTLLIILAVLMVFRFKDFSRSIFIIDAVLTLFALSGVRIAIRLRYSRGKNGYARGFGKSDRGAKRLLIIGAGDVGERIVREIRDSPELKIRPVGLLDDDPSKQGRDIHGVPVLGPVASIDHLGDRLGVRYEEILIAISATGQDEMRKVIAACEKTGKRYRTVPAISELVNGKVSISAVRKVTIEDLMGREVVRLEQDAIARYLKGKRVLVTGAGGSIGSELVRQVGRFKPQAIAVAEISELNLYRIEMECKRRFPDMEIKGYLSDVRKRRSVRRVIEEFEPHVIFHAAAYKHVTLQEAHPWEAVRTNVLGTKNAVEEAVRFGVGHFVLVSTDKAVRPKSVMGATKRVAEMLVECMVGAGKTRLVAVRFGNVLGSSGSAIPLFQEQIAAGGPVTVTHPEVVRYFMTIREAAQLILQAGAMGKDGDIFILDMGKPVRIYDMAKDLIRLHGLEPERDVAIEFIGLRPGEKMQEELITEGEDAAKTGHDKIMVLRGDHRLPDKLLKDIEELLAVADSYDGPAIKSKLKEIVPEYTPESDEAG